jgi:hypothetical protein
MAYRIVRNTRQNALLVLTATNTAIVIVGNNSTSEIGLSTVPDDIIGCYIKQMWSSADSSAANGWTIDRGSNTVWQSDSTTWLDFAGNGTAITLDPAATLSLTRTGTFGTCMIELQKIYEATTSNY